MINKLLRVAALTMALLLGGTTCFAADCGKAFFGWDLNSGKHIRGTAQNEGKYANNPHDHGGETYKGIARKYNKKWKGWYIIDSVKAHIEPAPKYGTKAYWKYVAHLNRILDKHKKLQIYVTKRYHDNEWTEMLGDQFLSQYLAYKVFDVGVNCGTGSAALCLVDTVNELNGLETDFTRKPVVTPAMVRWINDNTKDFEVRKRFIAKFKDKVDQHYGRIIQHNPDLARWKKVWESRLYDDE